MSDLPLFDFLVYLVPGAITALGLVLVALRRTNPFWRILTRQQALVGFGAVILVFAAGLLTHLLASWLFWRLQGTLF